MQFIKLSYILISGYRLLSCRCRHGIGCGFVVKDSRVVSLIPKPGMVRFSSIGNFIYPNLSQYN